MIKRLLQICWDRCSSGVARIFYNDVVKISTKTLALTAFNYHKTLKENSKSEAATD